jgi:PRC-barrel domain
MMKHRIQPIIGGLACYLVLWGTTRAYGDTEVRRVSTLLGSTIQLQAGGSFGKIEDLIINDRGCIDFVIVVFEDKLFAVPFSITEVDFARRVVILDVERELLLRAPSFARNRFPDLSASSEFGRKVQSHFQAQSQRGERAPESRQPQQTKPPTKAPAKPPAKPPEKQPETKSPDKEKKSPEKKSPD